MTNKTFHASATMFVTLKPCTIPVYTGQKKSPWNFCADSKNFANGITWFRTYEQRGAWYDDETGLQLDTQKLNNYIEWVA